MRLAPATDVTAEVDVAAFLAHVLSRSRSGPYLSTPCGVLAPLHYALGELQPVTIIAREDTAVGVAAGAALAAQKPVVLMQNSGFGQSVNAYASLVLPYDLDVLTVISMRGVEPDNTEENSRMGILTPRILEELGADFRYVEEPGSVDGLEEWLSEHRKPKFVLIAPSLFGWHP